MDGLQIRKAILYRVRRKVDRLHCQEVTTVDRMRTSLRVYFMSRLKQVDRKWTRQKNVHFPFTPSIRDRRDGRLQLDERCFLFECFFRSRRKRKRGEKRFPKPGSTCDLTSTFLKGGNGKSRAGYSKRRTPSILHQFSQRSKMKNFPGFLRFLSMPTSFISSSS